MLINISERWSIFSTVTGRRSAAAVFKLKYIDKGRYWQHPALFSQRSIKKVYEKN